MLNFSRFIKMGIYIYYYNYVLKLILFKGHGRLTMKGRAVIPILCLISISYSNFKS